MAPISALNDAEEQIKLITHDLFQLIVQSFEYTAPDTATAMKHTIRDLYSQLVALHRTAPHVDLAIPGELIKYIEDGRNPDIYTREFVEGVQEKNQMLKGKTAAFAQFRDVLAREIASAVPEMRADVLAVLRNTNVENVDRVV